MSPIRSFFDKTPGPDHKHENLFLEEDEDGFAYVAIVTCPDNEHPMLVVDSGDEAAIEMTPNRAARLRDALDKHCA